jgi:DNA-binding GntR family transcriptional regulator
VSVESGVYEAMRDAIIRLELAPGDRLGFDELARRFGVSHTPIRQALRRLEGDGLVILPPRRGARVAPLTFEELEEVQSIRLGVEPLLARYSAVASTTKTTAEMNRRLTAIDATLAAGDLHGYIENLREFRDACYAAAGKPRLHRVVREQRLRAERYLHFLCDTVEALAASRDHQRALLDACLVRNGAAAEAATREALRWTLNRLGALFDRKSAAAPRPAMGERTPAEH